MISKALSRTVSASSRWINTRIMESGSHGAKKRRATEDQGDAAPVSRRRSRLETAPGRERRTASIRTYDNIVTQDHARAHYGDNHYGDQHYHHYARPGDGPGTIPADDDRLKQLLESLSFPQKNYRLTTIEPAYRQTCQWFFETPEYTRWRNGDLRGVHNRTLWLKGKPGAGKSTITKCALEYANAMYPGERNIHFFFNARGDKLEKSNEGMYRSLLHQVARDVPSILKLVHAEAIEGYHRTGWPSDLLRSLFRQAALQLASNTQLNCYIDALDEGEDEDQIRDMVAFFEELSEKASLENLRLSVYFASRHYPHISVRRSEGINLDNDKGHHSDITSYAQNKLICMQPSLKEELVTEIIKRSSGVFLWVVLVVRILNAESDRGNQHRLRTSLQEIPKGLDDLFSGIIGGGDAGETLLPTLLWVLFAKHPLAPVELYFAVVACAIPESSSSIVWDHKIAAVDEASVNRFVVSSSRGFLQIAPVGKNTFGYRWDSVFTKSERTHTHRVQFIHESVREYLLKTGIRQLDPTMSGDITGRGNLNLARWCERYLELTLPSFDVPHLEDMDTYDTEQAFQRMLTNQPFLPYALAHIPHHSEEAARRGFDGPMPFEGGLHTYLSLYLLCDTEFYVNSKSQQTSLHVLIRAGCPHLIVKLLDQRPQDARQSYISCRIDGGIQHNRSALELAVDTNRLDILQILLRYGADVHARGEWNATILLNAVNVGAVEMVQEILDHGVDVNAGDEDGRTALHRVAESCRFEMIELLLRNNANVNACDNQGMTALLKATGKGNFEVIELLLQNNADVNASDNHGTTALHTAAEKHDTKLIELLLQNNADVNARDLKGLIPLHRSTWHRRIDVVGAKLRYGGDLSSGPMQEHRSLPRRLTERRRDGQDTAHL
jgi:ankyrin repeat protein